MVKQRAAAKALGLVRYSLQRSSHYKRFTFYIHRHGLMAKSMRKSIYRFLRTADLPVHLQARVINPIDRGFVARASKTRP